MKAARAPARPAAALLAAALLAAILPAAGRAGAAEASAPPLRVTLGYVPSSAFLAAYAARERGIFARHGLDVSFDMVSQVALLRSALAAGTVQIATLNVPALLRVDDDRDRLVIVAGAARQTAAHSTAGIVAGAKSNIHAAADFQGRKVGVPGLNGVNHLAFMQWLQDRGADPRRVRYVAVLLPRMDELLKTGAIDAAVPVGPFLPRMLEDGSAVLIARFPDGAEPDYIEAAYAMRRSWVREHPEAVAAFRDSLREALRWIAEKPQEAQRVEMRYLKIGESAALSAPLPELVVDVTAADVQYWIDLCRRFGVTRGRLLPGDVLAD